MEPVPVFLNDASYPMDEDDGINNGAILQILRTLREMKSLSRPFILGSAVRLWDAPLTNAYRTLASFAGVVDREWRRFVIGLDQYSPFTAIPMCLPPDVLSHVLHPRENVQAALWVIKNQSFLLSFPGLDEWKSHVAKFGICECSDGAHNVTAIDCRNFSNPNHIRHWRSEFLDYGSVEASSSTIYECSNFFIRMYLRDHPPAHVHVYVTGDRRDWIAKIRIDHVEVMEDRGVRGRIRNEMLEIVRAKQEEMLRAWDKCRAGQLPNMM